ncbi:MAG: Uma2 family endonuclease [Blastocatellia bacterium]|nr:Uma2 family endonuclease [Blastocatellia bacterium]
MNQTSIDSSKAKNTSTNERPKVGKYETLDGRLLAKPAVSRSHNLICTNFVSLVGSRVHRSSCEVYACDMQVQLGRDSVYFPDVIVVKGEAEFADENAEMLTNPTIVVEIFSSSSKSSYRAQKLEGYLAIPKLKECLLVGESEMRVEHYAWQNAKQWIYRIYNEREDVIVLDSINCKLALSEVYAQVNLRGSELNFKAAN